MLFQNSELGFDRL